MTPLSFVNGWQVKGLAQKAPSRVLAQALSIASAKLSGGTGRVLQ